MPTIRGEADAIANMANIAALLDRYGSAEAVQRRAADYIETAVEAMRHGAVETEVDETASVIVPD